MLIPKQQFAVGTRVKLKDGIDPSFTNGFGRVGNEGWVRKCKKDKYGFGQVFIEWDKDAWGFNGTEDGWTHENHFEAVEENDMDDLTPPNKQEDLENTVREITEHFVKSLFGVIGKPDEQIEAAPVTDLDIEESEDDSDRWEDLATKAINSVTDAPAYLIIALEQVEVPGAPPMVIPRVFHAAREPEFSLILQSQLAHVLASLQDATIATVLDQQKEDTTNE